MTQCWESVKRHVSQIKTESSLYLDPGGERAVVVAGRRCLCAHDTWCRHQAGMRTRTGCVVVVYESLATTFVAVGIGGEGRREGGGWLLWMR